VLGCQQSGDSGHSPGDSGPEGPEYSGLYPEYPDKNTPETLGFKNQGFCHGISMKLETQDPTHARKRCPKDHS